MKRWTKEEEEIIISLRNEGLTNREIALRLPGRTEAAVKTKAAKLQVKNRPWLESEKRILVDLKRKHKSANYIARVLNRSASAINTYYSANFKELHNG